MNIEIRECTTIEELTACVDLQRKVFALPDIELSPVRHLIVTKHAGGFSLGAYIENNLVGFVLSVPAFLRGEKAFYSHMTAVSQEFQSYGIGGKLKWSQRERALAEGVKFIKWTFQPVQARNAFFNLEKLGATIKHYEPNFYGTDYSTSNAQDGKIGLDSDRLFAEWNLESEKVLALTKGENFIEQTDVKLEIEIPNNWNDLVKNNPKKAVEEQNRIKSAFQNAFEQGLVCKGFKRDENNPKYLLY
ncbi:MAG: GNAT family N-acetyltransferase [Pyrinomonadaceae bacterium]|jgi:predicted GNAT superfamily acetyltransferase|nr:GNAT family N-acetyltransferase [Pyrinomonadaceae bacterium]